MFSLRKILYGSVLIAAFLLITGCPNTTDPDPNPTDAFVAVTDITGVHTGGFTGTAFDLGAATVTPGNATHNTITWTVKYADTTGVTDTAVAGGSFTPPTAGTLTLTATIANGATSTTPFAKDFTIYIATAGAFVPVRDITGVPDGGFAGAPVSLAGATVVPDNANNRTIVWSVKTAGAGVASITGNSFTPSAAGSVVLTATIANGESATTNYTQEFTITISAEGAFVAVTGITGVPEDGVAGSPVSLAGATVVPSNATNKTISWTVATPGAGVTSITGSSFTPTTAGTVTLTARILSGLGDGPYTQDFTFEIAAAFLAVSDISGLPTALVTGTEIDLNAGVSVVPPEATNKDIVWSIKPGAANTTGLTDATVATGVFTPQAGTVTLTATILNGRGQGSNFTKDTAAITIITPVTGITGVPSEGTKGYVVDLSGASVEPSAATNKTIVWSVTSAGDTGVTTAGIVGGKFTPAGTGNLVLTATIANGSAVGTAFEQEYPITIYEPGEFSPGFGFGDDTSILLRGGADQVQLSRDTAIEIAKDSVYYVSLITSGGNYTDVVWYLNGAKQTIGGSGALIYLDTSTARTISLAVIGTRGGLLEGSGIYTFTIK